MKVEVVCRFVEYQKIYRAKKKLEQGYAGLFSSGKNVEAFENVVAAEQEGTKHISKLWNEIQRGNAFEIFQNGAATLNRLGVILTEVAYFYTCARSDCSCKRGVLLCYDS